MHIKPVLQKMLPSHLKQITKEMNLEIVKRFAKCQLEKYGKNESRDELGESCKILHEVG